MSSAGRVIEADLPNVIEKNVYLMDTYGSLNKATYINKDDPAQRAVYYLDGETGKPAEEPKSRITPVFFKVEYIEGAEDFALEAEQRAREDLTPEDFDNLIEITVHDGDKLIPPEKIRIGEIVTIKANGQSCCTSPRLCKTRGMRRYKILRRCWTAAKRRIRPRMQRQCLGMV